MPNAWRIGNLTMAGVTVGICLLAFWRRPALGKFEMGLGIDALRTLAFVVLVFGRQATLRRLGYVGTYGALARASRSPCSGNRYS